MSDEHNDIDDVATTDDTAVGNDSVESESGGEEPEGTRAATTSADSRDPLAASERLLSLIERIRKDNRNRIGTLVLHTRLRDIELTVDGDAALRAIAVFGGKPEYQDPLTPEMSSAANGWVGIDFDQLVAVSWLPDGGDRRAGRVTIDPTI